MEIYLRKWQHLALVLAAASPAAPASELDDALAAAMGGTVYMAPTQTELGQAEALFGQVLGGERSAELSQDWGDLSMQFSALPGASGLWRVQEQSSARTGRGFYAFPGSSPRPWILQAPHGDSDLYTKTIATRLAEETPFAAVAWNTVHRDTPVTGESTVADLSHLGDSYFQRLTKAFAAAYPAGRMIQIHGFAQSQRTTEAGQTSDMIVSGGTSTPEPWLVNSANCLKTAMPGVVRLYPSDVTELGGTTNAQGILLRSLGHPGFMHVEMSKPLRQTLRDNANVRAAFTTCIQ